MVLSQILDKSESVRLFLLWNTVGALFVNIVYDCVKMCRPVNPIAVVVVIEMLLSTFSISRLHWSKKQKAEEVEMSKEWEKNFNPTLTFFPFLFFLLWESRCLSSALPFKVKSCGSRLHILSLNFFIPVLSISILQSIRSCFCFLRYQILYP